VFFRAVSTETVPNVTGHHFLTFFVPSYFLITNMHVATEKFSSVMHFLLLLNWSWSSSWSYTFDLGLGLTILVLVLTFWSCFHHCHSLLFLSPLLELGILYLYTPSFYTVDKTSYSSTVYEHMLNFCVALYPHDITRTLHTFNVHRQSH